MIVLPRDLPVILMQGTVQWGYVMEATRWRFAAFEQARNSSVVRHGENDWRTCLRGDSVGVCWEFSASSILWWIPL
jgi:hypothetical protein